MTDTTDTEKSPTTTLKRTGSGLQTYLDRAVAVLDRFGIMPEGDETAQLSSLLEEVADVDEAKITAIAEVIQYITSFNELMRNEVEDIRVADRYGDISQSFDSVRTDARTLVDQLADGEIDFGEKLSNLWMRFSRGSLVDRFQDIHDTYLAVADDTEDQLDREETILRAYIDFRSAMNEGVALAYEVRDKQKAHLDAAKAELEEIQGKLDAFDGDDAGRTRLKGDRDRAILKVQDEESRFQLLTDVLEQLEIGYNVGDTIMAKLQQTHDLKKQVHRRSVTFFRTNEHTFTALAVAYTAGLGLHETTQTLNAMTEGVNKSLEDLADLSGDLEEEGIKAAYGPTVKAKSLEKLVDAIVGYQTKLLEDREKLREESAENAQEIKRIVEDGRKKAQNAMANFSTKDAD